MPDLTYLANRMKQIKANLAPEVSRCCIETGITLEQYLVYTTPVDTSNALSNWQGSLDQPITSEIFPYVPGVMGLTKLQSAAEALEVFTQKMMEKKPGQTIFISNNAPYIRDLNNGTSKQAPAGFVENCELMARQSVKNFKMVL